jgi:N-acetylneuraminic acid mutarotase
MKSFLVLMLCFSQLLQSQTWSKIADFPSNPRDDGSRFVIGNNVYCGLGSQSIGGCAKDFFAFDLATETWSAIATMPSGMERQYASGFSMNGNGYIFGGINCGGVLFNDLWEYNPTTNTWSQKTAMPAVERYGCVSFVINNIVYIVGGKTLTNNGIPDVWAYDIALNSWSQKTSMPTNGMWRGVSYQYNGLGIVGLGLNGLNQYNKLFYEYNPVLDSWNTIASLSHGGRTYSGYSQINQYGYLFGGIDSLNVIYPTFEKINLQNYTITSLTAFTDTARKGCMAFTGSDAFYVTTGISATKRFNSTWKISQIVGINEVDINQGISVYPNPTTETITIQSNNDAIIHIEIYDLFGKRVLYQEVNEKIVHLKLPLPKGVYILKGLTSNNYSIIHKIVIN